METGTTQRRPLPASDDGPPATGRSRPLAEVAGPPAPVLAHPTLLGALEAGAAQGAPFVTLHEGKEPVSLDARDALDGAHRYGALLRSRGVRPGDRVPILLPTSCDFIEALLGTMLIGAVPTPLAAPMTFGGLDRYLHNLTAVIRDARATVMITYGRIHDAMAEDGELQALLEHVLLPSDREGLGPSPRAGTAHIDGAHPALIQYTSGTTGLPKGVVISHDALVHNAAAIASGLGITPNDVGVSWLPMFHDMGLIGALLTAVCHPYPLHLMRPESFVMQPRRWLKLLTDVRATLTTAPNFAYDLCISRVGEYPEGNFEHLRLALNGAEPVHASTLSRFADQYRAVGFDRRAFLPVYGMAENTLAVAFARPGQGADTLCVDRQALEERFEVLPGVGDAAATVVSVGYPVAGSSIRVAGDDGQTVREGRVGEVLVAGPSLMDGYYENPEATGAALRNGWLHSGDLGFVDGGRLFITGRAKELIIKGGRNIYPYDVERVAGEVEGVRGGVAAFARDNDDTGTDDLVVIAEVRSQDPEKREEIKKAIRGELLAAIGVKADAIHLWPIGGLPRTTSGKIQRRACGRLLRQQEDQAATTAAGAGTGASEGKP